MVAYATYLTVTISWKRLELEKITLHNPIQKSHNLEQITQMHCSLTLLFLMECNLLIFLFMTRSMTSRIHLIYI